MSLFASQCKFVSFIICNNWKSWPLANPEPPSHSYRNCLLNLLRVSCQPCHDTAFWKVAAVSWIVGGCLCAWSDSNMVKCCSVVGCKSRAHKDSGHHFHRFPREPGKVVQQRLPYSSKRRIWQLQTLMWWDLLTVFLDRPTSLAPTCAYYMCFCFSLFCPPTELKLMWVHALNRGAQFKPTHDSVVCSNHFLPSDYDSDDRVSRLKSDAVPCLGPELSYHPRFILAKTKLKLRKRKGSTKKIPPEDRHRTWLAAQAATGGGVSSVPIPYSMWSIVSQDHSYSFPPTVEAAKAKLDKLQALVDSKVKNGHKERKLTDKVTKSLADMSECLHYLMRQLQDRKLISRQGLAALQGRFPKFKHFFAVPLPNRSSWIRNDKLILSNSPLAVCKYLPTGVLTNDRCAYKKWCINTSKYTYHLILRWPFLHVLKFFTLLLVTLLTCLTFLFTLASCLSGYCSKCTCSTWPVGALVLALMSRVEEECVHYFFNFLTGPRYVSAYLRTDIWINPGFRMHSCHSLFLEHKKYPQLEITTFV